MSYTWVDNFMAIFGYRPINDTDAFNDQVRCYKDVGYEVAPKPKKKAVKKKTVVKKKKK